MFAKLKAAFVNNPKTSFAGVGVILSGVLVGFGVVTVQQGSIIAAALAGIGLILAGDAVPPMPTEKK